MKFHFLNAIYYRSTIDRAKGALDQDAIEELRKYRNPPSIIKELCGFLCELLKLESRDWTFAREQLLTRVDLTRDLEAIDKDYKWFW